jgi:hypothetical protein
MRFVGNRDFCSRCQQIRNLTYEWYHDLTDNTERLDDSTSGERSWAAVNTNIQTDDSGKQYAALIVR